MLAFFLSGSALSQRQGDDDPALAAIWEKGGRRDAAQVVANGGVAALAALIHARRPGDLSVAAGMGALAASTADTWATEIGVRSSASPRRITDGRIVPTGLSGGVTPVGLAGGLVGAMLLAGVAVATRPRRQARSRRSQFIGLSLAGSAGSLLDSLLGATVQARRVCPVCHLATERRVHRCGTQTLLAGGWAWFDNDAVNLAAAIFGGIVAMLWEGRPAR